MSLYVEFCSHKPGCDVWLDYGWIMAGLGPKIRRLSILLSFSSPDSHGITYTSGYSAEPNGIHTNTSVCLDKA